MSYTNSELCQRGIFFSFNNIVINTTLKRFILKEYDFFLPSNLAYTIED